jgi:histidyl-tRNA synthetase
MFRYDRPQKGRYRQFHQIDVEVFGEPDPAIDAEIIEMAYRFLQAVKVEGVTTLVNSVGCPRCRPAYGQALREAAAKVKDKLCPDCQRKAEINPLRIFDCKLESCQAIARTFPLINDFLCEDCREHFSQFLSYLELYHLPYKIEPRLVRGLDYYTKTTFELVVENLGAQNAIGGGGRYDEMVKEFGGPDLCGTGLAIGLERLLLVSKLEAPPQIFAYFAYSGQQARQASLLAAKYFRSCGIPCLLEFKERSLKSQLIRANKVGAAWTVIIGEDELASGQYQLKDMVESRQYKGSLEELARIMVNKGLPTKTNLSKEYCYGT